MILSLLFVGALLGMVVTLMTLVIVAASLPDFPTAEIETASLEEQEKRLAARRIALANELLAKAGAR